MKFGVCLPLENILRDPPAHADYLEISASEIAELDDARFEQLRQFVKSGAIRTYSANNLIPPSIRLTGEGVDLKVLSNYCDRVFEQLATLGVTVLVLGSGKSRQVPEGFPMERAWKQLMELGSLLARKAKSYGQTVVIEPLAYTKVNILHTVAEGATYAKAIGEENFRVLADFFHFDANGEPYASLTEHRDLLAHTHFATSRTRTMPKTEEDWAFFTQCLRALREADYTAAMSFEGGVFSAAELNAMLDRMKQIEQAL